MSMRQITPLWLPDEHHCKTRRQEKKLEMSCIQLMFDTCMSYDMGHVSRVNMLLYNMGWLDLIA